MKATHEQMGRLSMQGRQRVGDWCVTVPNGPHSLSEYRRFLESLPASAEPQDCVQGKVSGGNGVGWPGYYDLDVIAIYQPVEA